MASAVGFDEARGDQITIRSMQFQPARELEAPLPPSFIESLALDVMSLIQIAVLALTSLILGLFVVRPILSQGPTNPETPQLVPPSNQENQEQPNPVDTSLPSLPALDGEVGGLDDFAPLGELPSFESIQSDNADPAARLRELIEQKQDETVEVLSQWMNEPQEASR